MTMSPPSRNADTERRTTAQRETSKGLDMAAIQATSLYDELGPWPEWLTSLRPHQETAITEILAHYESGKRVVFLEAPTGAGKTVIAEGVRRGLRASGVFTCSTRSLQRQVIGDFPKARLLEGRANYVPESQVELGLRTCDDCDFSPETQQCSWCNPVTSCPYRVAKERAIAAPLAVLNTSYLLAATNFANTFTDRGLTIVDEADLLPDALCDFAGTVVTKELMEKCKLHPPSNVSDVDKLNELLPEWCLDASDRIAIYADSILDEKKRDKAVGVSTELNAIGCDTSDVKWIVEGVNRGNKDDHPRLEIKAVQSAPVARAITRHVDRMLVMSATLISAELMARDLNLPKGSWGSVMMGSTFEAHRRVIMVPRGLPVLTSKVLNGFKDDDGWVEGGIPERTRELLVSIMHEHHDQRILIHTPSYKLADQVAAEVRGVDRGRKTFTYSEASERERVLSAWLGSDNGILISPSFARGLDLKHGLCRVQIVFKLAIPNIGAPQVKARLYGEGGNAWMALVTIREFIQAAGRVCRSADDWGVTYVLDGKLAQMFKQWPKFFPKWFAESIITETTKSKGKATSEAFQAVGGMQIVG